MQKLGTLWKGSMKNREKFPKADPCEYCGKEKDDVSFREDPYNSDVNEDHTKHWICDSCHQERADDI